MKISKDKLRKLINEEYEKVINEGIWDKLKGAVERGTRPWRRWRLAKNIFVAPDSAKYGFDLERVKEWGSIGPGMEGDKFDKKAEIIKSVNNQFGYLDKLTKEDIEYIIRKGDKA